MTTGAVYVGRQAIFGNLAMPTEQQTVPSNFDGKKSSIAENQSLMGSDNAGEAKVLTLLKTSSMGMKTKVRDLSAKKQRDISVTAPHQLAFFGSSNIFDNISPFEQVPKETDYIGISANDFQYMPSKQSKSMKKVSDLNV